MSNQLTSLKEHTTIVADTGDFESIQQYQPQDATTNPSLILKAAQQDAYQHIVDSAVSSAASKTTEAVIDQLLVLFGLEILKIVPGRVSTEVDARLSFDTDATVAKGREIIALYEANGATRDRILIKIACTWEGIKAAEILEKDGIRCNLTLLFSMAQAVACAEANVQLISPFVGRIYDWYKKETGIDYVGAEDPGVISVSEIYNYYKKFGYKTEVMGASFRNVGQITELCGCDLLTISPNLLEELQNASGDVAQKLDQNAVQSDHSEKITLNQADFRFMLNEDPMATQKTAEGIRAFSADIVKLEKLIESKL